MPFKLIGKIELRGPGPLVVVVVVLPGCFRGMAASYVQRGQKRITLSTEPLVVNIIVNYFCICVYCTRKRLKETDTEETIRLFCHIFVMEAFQLGGLGKGRAPWLRL